MPRGDRRQAIEVDGTRGFDEAIPDGFAQTAEVPVAKI
jgi:hypothetical protein